MKAPRLASIIGVTLACLVGVLTGTGAYTFYYADGAAYLSNDPRACVNCHVMREVYDGWQHASHHAVATCNDCHVPHDPIGKWFVKARSGYHHSRAFTLQDFHEPIQIQPASSTVLNGNCVYCHSEVTAQIRTAAGDHTAAMDCVRCHRSSGHGPTE